MANQYVGIAQQNGMVTPSGCCMDCTTGRVRYIGTPASFAPQNARSFTARGGIIMSPAQIADALAVKSGENGGLLSSQYQATDVPGRGATEISRAEMPGGISANGSTYTVILDNTQALSVDDYKIFGDIAGTYAIAQSLGPVAGSTLVVSGSAGALSLSHLTSRAAYRSIKIQSMQIKSLTEAYFTGQPIKYFNTTPNPQDNITQKLLSLSTLVQATQYNPTIQTYETAELYDGINGLRINVPRLEKVTITMTIVSEGQTSFQNLLGT